MSRKYVKMYGRLVPLLQDDEILPALDLSVSFGEDEQEVDDLPSPPPTSDNRPPAPPQVQPPAPEHQEVLELPPSPQPGPSGVHLPRHSSPASTPPCSPPTLTELQPLSLELSSLDEDSDTLPSSPQSSSPPSPPARGRYGRRGARGARVRAGLVRTRGRRVGRVRGPQQRARTLDEGWGDSIFVPQHGPFTGTPRLNVPVPTTPLGFFQLFFTRELLRYLAEETNMYADQMMMSSPGSLPWMQCTDSEMAKFLGLLMLMGLMDMPTLRHYWSNDILYHHPIFSKTMSGRRWLGILRYFHTFNLKAVHRNNTDRLIKVRPVMEYVRQRSMSVYTPTEHLSLDEGGMPWRGQLNFRVYNPSKPDKYVIKLYMLAEAQTGYIYNFEVYSGVSKSTKDTVCALVETLMGKGYKLYMDNYYNSVDLCSYLFDHQVYVCGTLRLARGAPRDLQQLAKTKLADDTVVFRHKGNVLVLLWKDKRVVSMVTSFHSSDTVEKRRRIRAKGSDGVYHYHEKVVQKPVVIEDYNVHMSGVDHFDQMISYYKFTRKTQKWTKKMIFYLLQMAIFNSFVIYRKYSSSPRKLTLLQYHEHVIRKLIRFKNDDWPLSGLTIDHAPDLPDELVMPPFQRRRPARGHAPPALGRAQVARATGNARALGRVVARGRRHLPPPPPPPAPPAPGTSADDLATPPPPVTQPAPASPLAHASPQVHVTPGSTDVQGQPQDPAVPHVAPAATPGPALPTPGPAPPPPPGPTPPQAPATRGPVAAVRGAAAAPARDQGRKRPRSRIQDPDIRLDTSVVHVPVKIKDKKRLRCRVCYVRQGVRKDTYYECVTCGIALCLGDCFQVYHSVGNLAT